MGKTIRRIGCFGATSLLLALCASSPAAAATVPLAEFGSEGSGAGQLQNPSGMAIQPVTGNLYVADSQNDRVSVFGPAGNFIHAFGQDIAPPDAGGAFEVCTTATGCIQGNPLAADPGALNRPDDLAFHQSGDLYVLERSGNRISVFEPDGPAFIRAFGFGSRTGASALETCTALTGCVASPSGGGPGQLNLPTGLAIHDSLVYVGDQDNNRVSVFDAGGPAFVRAFGWDVADPDGDTALETCPTDGACRAGDFGGGAGQLGDPVGLVVGGGDTLHVIELGGHRVSVFDVSSPLGAPPFLRAFGVDVAEPDGGTAFEVCPAQGACRVADQDTAAGGLTSPSRGALDASGNLYVAETNQSRVSVFGTAGPTFSHAFGWGVDTGASAFEICTAMSTCQGGLSSGGNFALNTPDGAAVDCRGAVYVVDDTEGDVQRFGEPGTQPGPCMTTTTPPGTTPTPPKKKCKKGQKLKKGKCVKKKRRKKK